VMIKNYFKIAWRNLLKDKQFALLNVLGLSAGLACTLLIFLWVNDELSFDKFFSNDDQVYQLMEHQDNNGSIGVSDGSSGLLSDAVKQQAPEVEYDSPLAPPGWFPKLIKILKPRVNMRVKIISIFFLSNLLMATGIMYSPIIIQLLFLMNWQQNYLVQLII